jgi:hypothetical protein
MRFILLLSWPAHSETMRHAVLRLLCQHHRRLVRWNRRPGRQNHRSHPSRRPGRQNRRSRLQSLFLIRHGRHRRHQYAYKVSCLRDAGCLTPVLKIGPVAARPARAAGSVPRYYWTVSTRSDGMSSGNCNASLMRISKRSLRCTASRPAASRSPNGSKGLSRNGTTWSSNATRRLSGTGSRTISGNSAHYWGATWTV